MDIKDRPQNARDTPLNERANFDKGAFLVSRSIFESEIWFKPPEYIKIWLYILGKANHRGRKYSGYYCERGQYFCNYKELANQIEYKIGYRKTKNHESRTKHLMKFLRNTQMIDTTKEPRGILITVLNYDKYQTLKNYERTNEGTNERTSNELNVNQECLSINKNYKNEKNNKKEKKKFLDFVFLSDKEEEKLRELMGNSFERYVEGLNNHIGSTGKKYEGHYHTLLSWYRKDNPLELTDEQLKKMTFEEGKEFWKTATEDRKQRLMSKNPFLCTQLLQNG